jgi:hypothetical protein
MWVTTIVVIVMVMVTICIWQSNLKAKEYALYHAEKRTCLMKAQWLDQTATLIKIRLHKNPQNRIRLYRYYLFEYTLDGSSREQCMVIMEGYKLYKLNHIENQHNNATQTSTINENQIQCNEAKTDMKHSHNIINFPYNRIK